MKVDLVMWTKNGEKFLPRVLERIERVIPQENVINKILVDDSSTDTTIHIAKEFNWNVYLNEGGGIPNGANLALKHVTTDYFVSVEQDVVLAKDWWDRVPNHLNDERVACAQGIRLASNSTLRKLDEYVYSRLESDPLRFGVSIDNNIFRTKMIRQMGSFPNECPTCMDTILMKRIVLETPYKWIIDTSVISDHLREDILEYIRHSDKLSRLCSGTKYCVHTNTPFLTQLKIFLLSPVRGAIVAAKKRCFPILWAYPLIRCSKFKAQFIRRIEK